MRSRMMSVAFAATLIAAGGCAMMKQTGPAQPVRSLIVTNRSSFELVVYALPSPEASGNRLGSVGAFSTTTLKVALNTLQSDEALMVRIHPIGSRLSVADWVSPSVRLYSGMAAKLDVRADSRGDFSSSLFYTQAARDTIR